MVSRTINLGLRGVEFVLNLLIMSLVGNIIASAFAGNPSLINFDMFVAVFAMLSLFYLIAASFNESYAVHAIIPLALDALNTLFYFCAAIAMAAELGVHSCSNPAYTGKNRITNGSHDMAGRCREAQASTAFLWFGFIAWTASLVLSAFAARSGGVNLSSGGIRKGRPAMSQV